MLTRAKGSLQEENDRKGTKKIRSRYITDLQERKDEAVIEFKRNETQALTDDELDAVSGGTEEFWGGSATGVTCSDSNCQYAGPHIAKQYYDRVDNVITIGRLEVYCGRCKKLISTT